MNFIPTKLKEVILIEPNVFSDPRGFFMETYNRQLFVEHGITDEFVQMNHSKSAKNTLRGMHYQTGKPQSKLVRVVKGAGFDVVADIRHGSPTFGEWIGEELSAANKKMLYVPIGFAHGFCALTDDDLCIFAAIIIRKANVASSGTILTWLSTGRLSSRCFLTKTGVIRD